MQDWCHQMRSEGSRRETAGLAEQQCFKLGWSWSARNPDPEMFTLLKSSCNWSFQDSEPISSEKAVWNSCSVRLPGGFSFCFPDGFSHRPLFSAFLSASSLAGGGLANSSFRCSKWPSSSSSSRRGFWFWSKLVGKKITTKKQMVMMDLDVEPVHPAITKDLSRSFRPFLKAHI